MTDGRRWQKSSAPNSISFPGNWLARVSHAHGAENTESLKRVFPRFKKLCGEMFRRTAETHTAAEHFSLPFSEPGKTLMTDSLFVLRFSLN